MSDSPRPGAVLSGRYRLEEKIGSGGMATVWAATDTQLQRPVAVKVISETLAHDEVFMSRFRGEAQIAAAFAHPNVVRLYDFSADDERPFLVMERIDGGTLADRIGAGERVAPTPLARQLLAALRHIHAAGVVHRDVKPANVLFDYDDSASLTDFGIARSEGATRHTQTGNVIGTLAYMAPELQRGGQATPRSDLYSLGVVLEECAPDPAPPLARLIERLTATDPERRPDSADAALAELDDPTAATAPIGADPTEVMPAGPAAAAAVDGADAPASDRRGARWPLALGLLGIALVAVAAVALASGGGDDPATTPPAAQTTTVTEPSAEGPEPSASAPPESAAPLTEPPSEAPAEGATPPATPDCDQLEEQKKQLDDEKKAAEEAAGDDKEAKEAAKAQFEDQKTALDEQIKACKEAEKGG